ncbi:hypothetical protein LTR84_001086 [Exophiala bonariae]|uniref:Uncharacterized protein n=1 Tax=Exophiala bonariae TaxID=1690606 RepID=A0AAV9NSU2_9EURO|nr:hypothetical protein LTR84_001086 [Exophiala bonariae]
MAPPSIANNWLDLVNFEVPGAILSNLNARGIKWQKIENASGNLINLDTYSVVIDQFPVRNGQRMGAADFLSLFRKNINTFINTTWAIFSPFDASLDAKWATNSPLGAAIKIDAFGPDNAAVVVSEFSTLRWRFSTIETLFSGGTGTHPVSGTREFGMHNGNILYTRGADRTTGALESAFEGGAVWIADRLWRSMQDTTVEWINSNGGSASLVNPTINTLPWWG